MKVQSSPLHRQSGFALAPVAAAILLVVISALGRCPAAVAADGGIVVVAAAVTTTVDASCDLVVDAKMEESSSSYSSSFPPLATQPPREGTERCRVRPAPPEHGDDACDRTAQNARRLSEHTRNKDLPRVALIRDRVYLDLPEEKTRRCPPPPGDDLFVTRSLERGALGAPARWVVYNRSSGPVTIARVDETGAEVPATAAPTRKDGEGKLRPSSSSSASSSRSYATSTAVWPRGSILLPGSMAVVEGRQGHAYAVREYEEVLVPSFVEGVLPRTVSAPPPSDGGGGWTRFVGENDGVLRVSGVPGGRVLMTHVMGNVHVRNDYGAPCPMVLYDHDRPANAGRRGTPKDFNPNCNVLSKAFVNVVGCPVDVYFSPPDYDRGDMPARREEGPTLEDRACERFVRHLGPMGPYRATDPETRNLDDGWLSPLAFQNTYNRHSFVARMSHDGSLVARIDLDHDEVTDCPEPAARAISFFGGAEGMLEGAGAVRAPSNCTKSLCLALDDGSAAIAAVSPPRCSVDAKARDSTATPLTVALSASARIAA